MIDRDKLAEAARYTDALSEEHGFDGWARMRDIDPDGLVYVATQRALRAAMTLDGHDPRKLSRTSKTPVRLSPRAERLMPTLIALAMDSIAIGLSVEVE